MFKKEDMVETKDIALEEDIQNLKKISRIYIQKSDNPDDGGRRNNRHSY